MELSIQVRRLTQLVTNHLHTNEWLYKYNIKSIQTIHINLRWLVEGYFPTSEFGLLQVGPYHLQTLLITGYLNMKL